ncbi:MAG: type II CAAX prenyl endopeptidase Rce1 family protein [Candidatus Hodarchaeota archaeon]
MTTQTRNNETDSNISIQTPFNDFIMRNRLILFFVITLLYTWAFWIPMALMKYEVIDIKIPLIVGQSLGAVGPLVALFILTKASGGGVNLDKILNKIRIKKKEIFWLILATFIIPLSTILANFLNYVIGVESYFYILQPDKWDILGFRLFLIIPLHFFLGIITSPFFEEPGWRGFAVEELQKRFGRHIGSFIIGSYWWLWHQPINVAAGAEITIYSYFLWLAHSFIIDSLYNLSNRNLMGAMLAHASLIINFSYIFSGNNLFQIANNLYMISVFIILIIFLRVLESKYEHSPIV